MTRSWSVVNLRNQQTKKRRVEFLGQAGDVAGSTGDVVGSTGDVAGLARDIAGKCGR